MRGFIHAWEKKYKMIVVGLTGGIASGKSFVVKYLETKKIPVHKSDQFISDLYASNNKKLLSFLLKNGFEKSIINYKIEKKIIREDIFFNKNKKKILEKYLHLEVKKNRDIFLKKNIKQKIIFLDIPLLFENSLEKNCNTICSTMAPLYLREKRALQRRGMSKRLFWEIVKHQVKDGERKKKSKYTIDTSKTKIKTYLQVDNIIYDVLKLKKT